MIATEEKKKGLRGEELRTKIRENPKWFAKQCLGRDIWDKQEEIIVSAFRNSRTAVAGCVSSSKTNAGAILTFAWLHGWGPGSRVFTLAPSYRQVDLNLWGEIPKMFRDAPIPLGGEMMQTTQYRLDKDWYALGFSTQEPEHVHGIHGEHDLLLIDDAHAVEEEMYEEIENMMAGGQTHMVLLYNSHRVSGTTFDCRGRDRKRWNNIKISYWDTPNGKADAVVIPGMLKPETVKAWIEKYGKTSNFVKVKVDAESPTQAADSLFPMDWIQAAIDRKVPVGGKKWIGVDCAWQGDDSSVICPMEGRQVKPLEKYHGTDPMELADLSDAYLTQEGTEGMFDTIGIGAGVFSREQQRGRNVHAFVASESASGDWEGKPASEHFANIRAQAAWTLRTRLDPKNQEAIALPKDEELQAQLSAITYKINTAGKIQLQAKDSMKKELGYSPDEFDALSMAVWGATGSGEVSWSTWL